MVCPASGNGIFLQAETSRIQSGSSDGKGCMADKGIPVMEFIYPTPGVRIFIPRDQTGLFTRVISEVAHRNPAKKIFWHLDNKYIGTTKHIHQIEIMAEAGEHLLTVVDEDGNSINCRFTITGKDPR